MSTTHSLLFTLLVVGALTAFSVRSAPAQSASTIRKGKTWSVVWDSQPYPWTCSRGMHLGYDIGLGPSLRGDNLYVAWTDLALRVYDPATGVERWSYELEGACAHEFRLGRESLIAVLSRMGVGEEEHYFSVAALDLSRPETKWESHLPRYMIPGGLALGKRSV